MNKLSDIYKAIVADKENDWTKEKGWQPVYTANSEAKILIIGQAPGIRAQESGLPWNDPSGENLRDWMGVSRETFYDKQKIALVSMDFYYPGTSGRYDLPPRKGFADKWHPLILNELPNLELTLLIGQHAQTFYLGSARKNTLTETVLNYREYLPQYLPLIHPSPRNNIWHKRNPWFKNEVVPALQQTVSNIL